MSANPLDAVTSHLLDRVAIGLPPREGEAPDTTGFKGRETGVLHPKLAPYRQIKTSFS